MFSDQFTKKVVRSLEPYLPGTPGDFLDVYVGHFQGPTLTDGTCRLKPSVLLTFVVLDYILLQGKGVVTTVKGHNWTLLDAVSHYLLSYFRLLLPFSFPMSGKG